MEDILLITEHLLARHREPERLAPPR